MEYSRFNFINYNKLLNSDIIFNRVYTYIPYEFLIKYDKQREFIIYIVKNNLSVYRVATIIGMDIVCTLFFVITKKKINNSIDISTLNESRVKLLFNYLMTNTINQGGSMNYNILNQRDIIYYNTLYSKNINNF